MKVPFVDLHLQYLSIKDEIDSAIAKVIRDTSFIGGEEVKKFEFAFGKWIGVDNCIACANGTDSIEIILKAFGIGQGDEVIVPAHTWISTSEAVSNVGATPVFVDTLPDVYTINPEQILEKINERTKAIIPVHLFGISAEMERIVKIASENNLFVIEDCAQAHGALYKGRLVGSIGDAASFSFYPGKNLGAYGDAGAILIKNNEFAEKARLIANHGQKQKHNHIIEGRNSRLDGLQAAILNVKLPYIERWNRLRNEKAQFYSNLLNNQDLQLPIIPDGYYHVFHLYVIKFASPKLRDDCMKYLKDLEIDSAIHYPSPLPLLPAYSNRKFKDEEFLNSIKTCSTILSLPIFPEITIEQQNYVSNAINLFLK